MSTRSVPVAAVARSSRPSSSAPCRPTPAASRRACRRTTRASRGRRSAPAPPRASRASGAASGSAGGIGGCHAASCKGCRALTCKDRLSLPDKLVRVPEHVARGIDAQRVLPALLAMLVGCAMAAPAAGASVQNSCKYAYDNYYRDMEIDVDGSASIVEALPRYPAPTGTVVEPGQTIDLDGGRDRRRAALEPPPLRLSGRPARARPEHDPDEGVGRRPRDEHARGRARVRSDRRHRHDDDRRSTRSPTRTSATTAFSTRRRRCRTRRGPRSAATSPSARPVPARSARCRSARRGALRATSGSVLIQADVAGGVSFVMDCQPGATQDVNPTDGAGATFLPASARAVRRRDLRPAQRHLPQRAGPPRLGRGGRACPPASRARSTRSA